jgi:hypothetical protein
MKTTLQDWFGLFPGNRGSKGSWDDHGQTYRDRVQTEEFARDSFENLLFSICRFRQVSQKYPERITIVG